MFGQFLPLPTSQEATGYVNAVNKTIQPHEHDISARRGLPECIWPSTKIYKAYEWNEGDPVNLSEYTYREIEQLDNLVIVTTVKQLSS